MGTTGPSVSPPRAPRPEPLKPSANARVALAARVPIPQLAFVDLNGNDAGAALRALRRGELPTPRHAAHFSEASGWVSPVMHREDGEGGVSGAIDERQILRCPLNDGR